MLIMSQEAENRRQSQAGCGDTELNHNSRKRSALGTVMLLTGYIVSLDTKCCSSRTPESETNVETVGLRTL